MYRLKRYFSVRPKPQPEKSSIEHSQRMKRIRNIGEDRTLDLLWEGIATMPMPKVVSRLLAFSIVPQVVTGGVMIWADYNSMIFTVANSVGSSLLAFCACSQGAMLLGLEAMRYHPLNTDKLSLVSGFARAGLGFLQIAFAMVLLDYASREEWKGPGAAILVQILTFAFMLTSARLRVVPYWTAGVTGVLLASSGVLGLFMMHCLIGKKG